MHDIAFRGVVVTAPDGWQNCTDPVAPEEAPFTLANERDLRGALQITPSLPKGPAPDPSPTAEELLALTEDLGKRNGLGQPFDQATEKGELALGGVSFRDDDDFIRMWSVSDGKRVAILTYVCPWERREAECIEVETIVKSLRFRDAA
jgi:hypothetical protein